MRTFKKHMINDNNLYYYSINATANKMGINVDAGVSRFNGGIISQGTTINSSSAEGDIDITKQQLINGYACVADISGNVRLVLPGAPAVQTELTGMGITSAAGTRMPPIIVAVHGDNAVKLSVSVGEGETLYGSNEILKDKTAIIHYIFTEANTASVVIVTTP